MTNAQAVLDLLATLYLDHSALRSENAQLRADVQRLEAVINELQAPTET